jgi:ABC-type branched-subunit amino acid transport system ATPase component
MEPVLALEDVAVPWERAYDTGLSGASFALGPGELGMILLEELRPLTPLADVASGMLPPAQGRARFKGRDWALMGPDEGCAARARTRRVFAAQGWIDRMGVDGNLMLAGAHHTRRRLREIVDEARDRCREFGLPGLPRDWPSDMPEPDLRRAQCARAFMGEADLYLLERPEFANWPDLMPALSGHVRGALRRGAAVIWLTAEPAVWRDPGVPTAHRLRFSGPLLAEEAP